MPFLDGRENPLPNEATLGIALGQQLIGALRRYRASVRPKPFDQQARHSPMSMSVTAIR